MTSIRGKLVLFLCCLTLAGGLLSAPSEIAHAQSTDTFKLSGTVTDGDGAPVVGYTVEASGFPSKFVTRADGSYDLVFFSFTRGKITVGDTIDITVLTAVGDIVGGASYVVTAADVAKVPPGATVNIQLSGLSAELTPGALPADGISTATLNVSVQASGGGVTDDTLEVSAEKGKLGEVTNNGDGTYTATYTAPELALAAPTSDTVTVTSTNLGAATSAMITLNVVPTQISITAVPSIFDAGAGGTSAVTVSVTRGGTGISGANISVIPTTGTLGDVTDNGDGTYTATYTPPTAAGRATINAVDADSGARGSATITVNAGAAESVAVAAVPTTVSSGGTAMITATITDASGNGVGGQTLSATANSGTVGDFTEAATMGDYTAEYTAPTVDAASTDVVTVTSGLLIGVATVGLTPEPPKSVGILVVSGTVNKSGGTGAAPGVNVAVSVGGGAPLTATSGSNGAYSVTIVASSGNAASTGDSLSVVATDGSGAERGRSDSVLTNADLGDGPTAIVTRDVTTDILAASSTLAVSGAVLRQGSKTIAVNDVFDITVTNADASISTKTEPDGSYSGVTFLSTTGFAAETGDMITVTASRGGVEVGTASHTLTSAEVDAAQVSVNVPTDIPASSSALSVTGTVYHEDGTVAMGAGLSVSVANAGRQLEVGAVTDANGRYEVTFFSASGPVAETADILTVSVVDDSAMIGSTSYSLTSDEVDAQRAENVDVTTSTKASTSTLNVAGQVFFVEVDTDDDRKDKKIGVGPNITVNVMNADNSMQESVQTGANGTYSATFFSSAGAAAETDDVLNVSVLYGGETAGFAAYTLTAADIDAQRVDVNVDTTIKAESSVFNVTGRVFREDGVSPAPGDLIVKVTNDMQGVHAEGKTNADGYYSVTFVSASMAVAQSADELACNVTVTADGDVVGTADHTLTTDEVVARRATGVNITCPHPDLYAAPSNLIVASGVISNPDGTPAAGVEVRLTLGANATRVLQTDGAGRYSTTFLQLDGEPPVVAVEDILRVQALDPDNSASANESMSIQSKHVLAQRVAFDIITLVPDAVPPVVDVKRGATTDENRKQKFVEPGEDVHFIGNGSTDNSDNIGNDGIDTWLWEFGDGTTANTEDATHSYADPGKYTVKLTATDLAGNEASASTEVFVGTVRLGGLALNTVHSRAVIDDIITLAIAGTDLAQSMGADNVLAMLRDNPAAEQALIAALESAVGPGAVPLQFLKSAPAIIFEQYENIDLENFGNAITAYPGDSGILNSEMANVTRVVTGDKLDLYLVAPRGGIGSATFRFEGSTSDATEVKPGETFPHTFHLEEEQALMMLPAAPPTGPDSGTDAFASVTLMYHAEELPAEYHNLLSRARHMSAEGAYSSAPLTREVINGKTVWTAAVDIEPGKLYRYYYKVTLTSPIEISMGTGLPNMPLTEYAFPDPRNLQMADRGIANALLTPAMQAAIAPLLNPVLNAIAAGENPSAIDIVGSLTGEEIQALLAATVPAAANLFAQISATLDPRLDSVFTVPMVSDSQSLWYGTVDLSNVPDGGPYSIDANAFDAGGVQIDNRPVYGKTFILDRAAPEYDLTVAAAESASMYTRDDGVLITTGLLTPDPAARATLLLTATEKAGSDSSHLQDYDYQIRRLGDNATAWTPIPNVDMPPMVGALTMDEATLFLVDTLDNILSINERAGMTSPTVQPLNMTIRGMNDSHELMVGNYALRVVAKDSVFNSSSDAQIKWVNIVAPDPDKATIANIEIGDCNKDGDLEDPFESGAPDENSTIFADTRSVKLTVNIARTPHPLTDLVVQYKTAHGTASWKDIEVVDVTGIVDTVDVQWDISPEQFAALLDGGGDQRVYVRAVATNMLTITDPDPAMTTIKLDGGVCPVPPEYIAVDVVPAGTNPETGGYCGILTINGYTVARTIPNLASVRFELIMPDGSKETIEATEWAPVSELSAADLAAVVGDAVDAIVGGAAGEVAYDADQEWRKWTVTLNTARLMDSLDEAYVVNATMVGADGMDYAPISGGSDSFMLHNGDVQVGTVITGVADAYGAIEMGEGGFYQLGGNLAEGLDAPNAIFTVDPAAPDWRVKTVELKVYARNEDGSKGDPVDVGETTVEETTPVNAADMTKTGSDKIFTITVSDLSGLGVGGDYIFQALAMDHKAAPDVEAEDATYGTAVNIDNYTPMTEMITINGRGEGMSLADFMAAHPMGYRIAQSDENAFPFAFSAPGALTGDISVQIDGETVAADLVTIEGTRHDFSLVVSTSATAEGDHPASATITKRNGSVSFDVVNLAIDRTAPVITVLSPIEDAEVSALPTIHAIYNDGEGYGIAVAPTDALDVAAEVEILITRMMPPDETVVPVNQDELEDADGHVAYSRDDRLAGGAYRTDVSVTDKWGNRSAASAEFTVVGTPPSVTILSPMADSVSDDGMPLISAALSGTGALDVVFTIDGEAIEGAVDGNNLSYAPESPLAEGDHTVMIQVTDPDGKMAEAAVTFSVELDHSPPVVTAVSPTGVVWGPDITLSVTAIDNQSGVASVSIALDGGDAMDGASRDVEGLASGNHTAVATVTNGDGYSQEYSWTFAIALDEQPPTIGATSPHGIVRSTMPTVSVSATDLTNIASIEIGVMASDGSAVEGETAASEDGTTASFTPSAELANGAYAVAVVVTDGAGNTASTNWSFTVEADYDTTNPSVNVVSPLGIVRVEMPTVSVSASDASDTGKEGLSGIASIDISVAASDGSAVDGSNEFDGEGSAVFSPNGALANGEYTASATVTDNSGNVNTASWTFTVEVIRDEATPVIGISSPSGIVRVDNPTISVSATDAMSGVASIDISVAASDGSAVDGASVFDGGTMAVFEPGAALANDTYTATAVVTDNAGNQVKGSWSFTVEVVMDTLPPTITVTSPQGLVRNDTPAIMVSATDDMSGVASIDISVAASDGSAVGGASEFDGGAMATFAPGAALANDTYTATAIVTDNAGNQATGSWSFTLEADDTEPVIGALSPQGIVRDDTPRITVTATDDISGIGDIQIRLLDPVLARVAGETIYEGGTAAAFVPAAGLANGTYSAAVDVTDKVGNTANASWSFTLEADRAAPVINATSPQGTVRTDTPRVSLAATDDLSGIGSIEIRVFNSDLVRIGGPTTYEGGTHAHFNPATALRNDTYTVGATVTDKAGNVTDASWSFTVQVDTTPPVISATSPLGLVREEMPRISVSATDDESGMRDIQIRVLNSAFVRMGGETRYAGGTTAVFIPSRNWRNDTYTVGVTAIDKSGNQADATWSFALEADHTPPVINVTSPQGIIRDSTPRVSVSATDDISGIAAFEIRVYDSRFVRVAGPTTFEGGTVAYFTPSNDMRNDTYTVGVKVTDKAGNTTDASWAFTVEVDTTPPTIGDTGPHGIIRSATPRVTVSATDDLSGIRSIAIRVVNSATFARVAGPTTFQGGTFASFSPSGNMDNGVYSVGVDVTDKSGNVASTGWSFTVEVDKVPPTIAHTSPSGSVRPQNPVISVAATDDLSGVANIQITLRDGNQNAVPGHTVFEGGTIGTFVPSRTLDFGTHSVGVMVKDKAGNVANASYSFIVESADGLAVLDARNYPNPFAGATDIAFTLTRTSEISIEIFDISMRPVWHMSPRMIDATTKHVIRWDGSTSGGEKLARGVYFGLIMVHDSLNPQHAVLKMAIK